MYSYLIQSDTENTFVYSGGLNHLFQRIIFSIHGHSFNIFPVIDPNEHTVRTEKHEQNISRRYQQIILIDLSWRLTEKRSLDSVC